MVKLNHVDSVSGLRGLAVKAMASYSKGVSSSLAVGKHFSFCKSRFRSLQLEEAHANEINHDIHLTNTLFQIKVRQKKYGCRLQWYITVHVSFKSPQPSPVILC